MLCVQCNDPIPDDLPRRPQRRFCSRKCKSAAYRARPENRAAALARVIAWQEAHPEATRQRKRDYAAKHPRQVRGAQLLNKYGMTVDEYDELLARQNGVCAICGRRPEDDRPLRRLHVDHDHELNIIRGLVCVTCNIGLGYVYEKPGWLAAVLTYLADPPGLQLEHAP